MMDKRTLKNLVLAIDPQGEHIIFSEDDESPNFGVRCEAMDDFALVVYPDGRIEDSYSKSLASYEVEQYLKDFHRECIEHPAG